MRYFPIYISVASHKKKIEMEIKSVLPSIMSEDRLTNMAILSTDHAYAKKIKFFIAKFIEVRLKTETVI